MTTLLWVANGDPDSRRNMADETKAPEQSAPSERPRSEGRPGGDRPGGDRPRFGGGGRGPGGPPREGGGGRKFFRRKKVCKFCTERIEDINYKDYRLLGQFVAESGKIVPRRLTGVCAPHQHRLSSAIKQARNIALLPFAGRAS
jgi:small subunit ribosomal protein S18